MRPGHVLPHGRRRGQRGFTIAELIIVVTIAGILVAIAMPNLSEFLKNNARANALNDVIGAINLARSQAVTTRSIVTLCPSTDGEACAGGADSNNFGIGYIVFVDVDGNGTLDSTDGRVETADPDLLVRVFRPRIAGDVELRGFDDTGNLDILQFTATGGARGTNDDRMIRYCDDRGADRARAVEIALITGQVRLSEQVDGAPDRAHGAALTCS